MIRTYGVSGLQAMIRNHLKWARELSEEIEDHPDFELLAPVPLNLICFRYHPKGVDNPAVLDSLNARLLDELNRSGKMYLTHTKLNGKYTLRFVASQTQVKKNDITRAWQLIKSTAKRLRME